MGDGPNGLIVSQARDRAAIDDVEDGSFGLDCGVRVSTIADHYIELHVTFQFLSFNELQLPGARRSHNNKIQN